MQQGLSGAVLAVAILLHAAASLAETLTLRSGKEIEIIDGSITAKGAEEVLNEAASWLRKGRLDYAREYWKLVEEKGQGRWAARAKSTAERLKNVEFESFLVLGNYKTLKGRVKANLRNDSLGLEGKDEIPIWQVEEISAEYHPGLSQVSKTFYPFALLEVKLREKKLRTTKMTGEIEFVVESAQRTIGKAVLGKLYELLRPEDLAGRLETITRDRIIKIVIYPGLTIPE